MIFAILLLCTLAFSTQGGWTCEPTLTGLAAQNCRVFADFVDSADYDNWGFCASDKNDPCDGLVSTPCEDLAIVCDAGLLTEIKLTTENGNVANALSVSDNEAFRRAIEGLIGAGLTKLNIFAAENLPFEAACVGDCVNICKFAESIVIGYSGIAPGDRSLYVQGKTGEKKWTQGYENCQQLFGITHDPTSAPTSAPSSSPSSSPTGSPTSSPSASPSTSPSASPTGSPTGSPVRLPPGATRTPSANPTTSPQAGGVTGTPSSSPVSVGDVNGTSTPTSSPVTTSNPTSNPVLAPTSSGQSIFQCTSVVLTLLVVIFV